VGSRGSYAGELGISAGLGSRVGRPFSRVFLVCNGGARVVAALGALAQAVCFAAIRPVRMELSIGSFGPALGAFDQQLADLHEIVGEHRGANKQFEVLGAFGATTLHATAAHQY
jgi:hypothetical protein